MPLHILPLLKRKQKQTTLRYSQPHLRSDHVTITKELSETSLTPSSYSAVLAYSSDLTIARRVLEDD